MKISENYSLKNHNTFGLEISSRWFCSVTHKEELQQLLGNIHFKNTPKLILGGGSNILFTKDFDGLVIQNRIEKIQIISEDSESVTISAGGGMNWHEFVLYTIEQNYGGLENLSLIPGCLGAAPIQNIGAYGVEIKNVFHSLSAIDLVDGSHKTFDAIACKFGYRDSIFKQEVKNKYAIVDVTFRLKKNSELNTSYGAIEEELKKMHIEYPTIRDVSNAVIAIRQSKLPDPKIIGNAGSFFKNPEVSKETFAFLKEEYPTLIGYSASDKMKLAAGWLIEQCGWKGKRIGNCGMHEKQALVLVNYGDATGNELLEHAKKIQESVKQKFGVYLEMEVNII